MKKTYIIALLALAAVAFPSCGNQQESDMPDQAETETDPDLSTPIETDTSITQDPDTATYHDMTL